MTELPTEQPTTSTPAAMAVQNEGDIESALSTLLDDLSSAQAELLTLLEEKRRKLVAQDRAGLQAMQADEERLATRLAECHQRREGLLSSAEKLGMPSRDLQTLAGSLPKEQRSMLRPRVRSARQQSRLLQHQSLTNWVLVQRTLLHLSQMVEIIATGGQEPPTYEKSGPSAAGGNLVDQAI